MFPKYLLLFPTLLTLSASAQTVMKALPENTTPAAYKQLIKNGNPEEPDICNRHNKYIAYYHLNAEPDTVFKYLNEAIHYEPIRECYDIYHGPYSTSKMFGKGYAPKQVARLKRTCDSIENRLDKALMKELKIIGENDQKYRQACGASWVQLTAIKWTNQNKLDSANQIAIAKLLDKNKKYIGVDQVGYELEGTAFLVIQHADLAYQEKYLPLIEQAVSNNQLHKSYYPLLVDRINMRKDLPQRYGTQLIWNKKKEANELYKTEDLKTVDSLRKLYQLGSLSHYLKQQNATIPNKWE